MHPTVQNAYDNNRESINCIIKRITSLWYKRKIKIGSLRRCKISTKSKQRINWIDNCTSFNTVWVQHSNSLYWSIRWEWEFKKNGFKCHQSNEFIVAERAHCVMFKSSIKNNELSSIASVCTRDWVSFQYLFSTHVPTQTIFITTMPYIVSQSISNGIHSFLCTHYENGWSITYCINVKV